MAWLGEALAKVTRAINNPADEAALAAGKEGLARLELLKVELSAWQDRVRKLEKEGADLKRSFADLKRSFADLKKRVADLEKAREDDAQLMFELRQERTRLMLREFVNRLTCVAIRKSLKEFVQYQGDRSHWFDQADRKWGQLPDKTWGSLRPLQNLGNQRAHKSDEVLKQWMEEDRNKDIEAHIPDEHLPMARKVLRICSKDQRIYALGKPW